jgi:hypothetical protein
MDTSKAAAHLGRKGGLAGVKASKVRGDSDHYRAIRAKRHVRPAPDRACIYYDTSVPGNHGWAYNVITDDEHESDALTPRRRTASLRRLVRDLRREYRTGRVEIPSAEQWRPSPDGNGWIFAR